MAYWRGQQLSDAPRTLELPADAASPRLAERCRDASASASRGAPEARSVVPCRESVPGRRTSTVSMHDVC